MGFFHCFQACQVTVGFIILGFFSQSHSLGSQVTKMTKSLLSWQTWSEGRQAHSLTPRPVSPLVSAHLIHPFEDGAAAIPGHLFQCLASWQQTSSYCLPQKSLIDVSTSDPPWGCSLCSCPHRILHFNLHINQPQLLQVPQSWGLHHLVTLLWTVSTRCTSPFNWHIQSRAQVFQLNFAYLTSFHRFTLFCGWYIPKCLPFSW